MFEKTGREGVGVVECQMPDCDWEARVEFGKKGKIKNWKMLQVVVSSHLMVCHGAGYEESWEVAKLVR